MLSLFLKFWFSPVIGDHYSGIQPNYKLQTMSPPQSSYDEGMKNIMAKLTPPEQEYLEHAMSVKSYLPPGKEYQSPKSVKGNRFSIMAGKAIL